MHWLAIVFLALQALADILENIVALCEHKYKSLLGYLVGTFTNIFAWYYVLNYVFSGVR